MVEGQSTGRAGQRYGAVPVEVLKALPGDAMAVAVYAALAAHADRCGRGARPRQDTLAELLGIKKATVSRAMNRLYAAGVVVRSPWIVDGRKVGNEYDLPKARLDALPGNASPVTPEAREGAIPRAREPFPKQREHQEMNNTPTPPEPHLAVVVPMPTGRMLDVTSIPDLVFNEWCKVTHRRGARYVLSDTNEKMIKKRVKDGFDLDDLLDAVRGLGASAWHNGANPTGQKWTALKYALGDADKVMDMRDRYRAAPSQQATATDDPAIAAVQRQRQREGRA